MNIKIHLNQQSRPIPYELVKNTHTKDGLFCVYKSDDTVDKYPLCNIFRIEEDYK